MSAPFSERPVTLARKRRREVVSCEGCRQRKLKCNRQDPCNRCAQSRTECVYSNPTRNIKPLVRRKTVPAASGANSLASSSSHMSGTSVTNGSIAVRPTEPRCHSMLMPSPTPVINPLQSGLNANENVRLRELESRVKTLEHLLTIHGPSPSSEVDLDMSSSQNLDSTNTDLPLQNKSFVLNKSRLFGQSHWTHAALEFHTISAVLNNEPNESVDDENMRQLKSEIHGLRRKCKMIARETKSARPTRWLPLSDDNMLFPTKELADSFAQMYVTHFESTFRILHIPSFWDDYERYWKNRSAANASLVFTVHLVLAIGSSICQESVDTARIRSSAREWIYSAQNWLAGPIEKDRLSISALQLQCLLILARQALSVGGDLVWIAVGCVLRTAMQMGLHRDPKYYARMSVLEAEIRRRLWATILEMNIQAALDSGTPPNICWDEFDTDVPSNINDEDINANTDVVKSQDEITATDSSLQRLLFRHLQARIEVIRCLNGRGLDLVQDKVLALHSEIVGACHESKNRIPRCGDSHIDAFKYNMADLLLRRFILSLHRLFARRAYTGPLHSFSREMCLESATALLSPLHSQEFSRLMLIGGGIFKNRIIHVSLAIASELIMKTEDRSVVSTRLGSSSNTSKRLLMLAIREACSQLEERMRLGETNPRLHMKLIVVLCQAECSDLGGPELRRRLVQDARDSLDESYSRLRAAAGSSISIPDINGDISVFQDVGENDFPVDFDLDEMLGMTSFGFENTY